MSLDTLHRTYAPILHFAQGERFFPMDANDLLTYAALHRAGERQPITPAGRVTPDALAHAGAETFLRTVERGPLSGLEVARDWGLDTLKLVVAWAQNPVSGWSDDLARAAYQWFSPKTASATRLFWWNSLLQKFVLFSAAKSGELPRFKLPASVRDSAAERYAASQSGAPRYTYYYRLVPQGDYLNLQYWFFYAYNDWAASVGGFNDHEGDWEGLHLFFRRDGANGVVEPPAYICYLGHHSRLTKPWDHADVQKEGTHPRVYVASGSHASYPERKPYPIMALYNLVDYATGDGAVVGPDDWRGRVALDDAGWLTGYLGSWGTRYWLGLGAARQLLGLAGAEAPREITLPGVSAPRGPRYTDEGAERETWSRAAAFAGI